MYGHVIGVNYRGSGTFQTLLGSFCTCSTYVVMLINIASLLLAFKLGTKQDETFQTVLKDRFISEPYNLNEFNLNIGIYTEKPIPPEIASIRAY